MATAVAGLNLMVHVKAKAFCISCGDGQQPVKWLANVGTARYDDMQGRALGIPVGVQLEDGSQLGLTQTLVDAGLKDQQHVWVVYQKFRSEEGGKKAKGGAAVADEDEDD